MILTDIVFSTCRLVPINVPSEKERKLIDDFPSQLQWFGSVAEEIKKNKERYCEGKFWGFYEVHFVRNESNAGSSLRKTE